MFLHTKKLIYVYLKISDLKRKQHPNLQTHGLTTVNAFYLLSPSKVSVQIYFS